MNYLTLSQIKKQLNIDTEFTDDDLYLTQLGGVAEEIVARHIDQNLSDLESEEGNLPLPIIQAMLLQVGSLYMTRENISNVNLNKIPFSYEYLLATFKNRTNFAS